jgi:hypothetical protein
MNQGQLPAAAPSPLPAMSPEPQSDLTNNRPSRRRTLWLLLGALGAVIVLGAGAYFLVLHRQPAARPAAAASGATSNQPTADASGDSTPTTYVSKGNDLNLSFTYPANWQAAPASGGNSDDQTITLTSPRTGMADAQDESVIARAVLTIRPKGTDITELDAGTATVAVTSYQIAYSSPTKVQHGYPFLTFVHLAGGSNPQKLFEEVMVTGAAKFSANQTLSSYSLLNLDPIISATFYQCSTQACTGSGAEPLSITSDIWQSSDLGQQVLGIFQSLQIH